MIDSETRLKKRIIQITLLFFLIAPGFFAAAQTTLQSLKLVNVVDGSTVALENYSSSPAIAILFTSNVCPYDGYYTARIKRIVEVYQGKIQFLLINSYQEDEESIDKMKATYPGWTISIPYLADKDQALMNALGAKKSPEAFLLKNTGGKFEIVYNGAIDDNAQASVAVSETYLRNAIDQVLNNQPVKTPLIRSAGCSIRKK